MPTETYEITLQRPDGVSVAELRTFIKDAVETWGGSLNPESHLFGSHKCTVKRKPPQSTTGSKRGP